MTRSTRSTRPRTHPRTSPSVAAPLAVAVAVSALALTLVASTAHADVGTPVPLGAASTFAVLAGAGVTNTGATTLAGDVGSFPTTSITGLGTVTLVGGVDHGGDAVAQQAKTDLVTAYDAASAQAPDLLGGVELAGLTVEPGVYDTGGVIELNGDLTLDANGDPDAVFIFRSLSTLLAGASSTVTFIDGASACNLYWRVPSSATVEAGSQFAGTVLAEMSISFGAGATLQGRALAQVGEVTLINNTITVPACSAAPPVAEPTSPPVTEPTTPPVTEPTSPPVVEPTSPPVTEPTTPAWPGDDGATTPWTEGSPADWSTGGGTPQVAVPPRGGVATGDGSSIAGSPGPWPAAAAVAVVMLVAASARGAVRTRRPAPRA